MVVRLHPASRQPGNRLDQKAMIVFLMEDVDAEPLLFVTIVEFAAAHCRIASDPLGQRHDALDDSRVVGFGGNDLAKVVDEFRDGIALFGGRHGHAPDDEREYCDSLSSPIYTSVRKRRHAHATTSTGVMAAAGVPAPAPAGGGKSLWNTAANRGRGPTGP
jgi:hypothetical protein